MNAHTRAEALRLSPSTKAAALRLLDELDTANLTMLFGGDGAINAGEAFIASRDKLRALLSASDDVPDSLRLVAKRNLRSLIERGSDDKATMLSCLEELS